MSTPNPESPPVQILALSKQYRLGFMMNSKVRALEALNLEIRRGEVFGLLGPNGAGKSTTIKILLNLVKPSSGEARLFGLPPQRREARREVGYVPENPAPYEYLTGREFVTLAARIGELRGPELRSRVEEVLALVGMSKAAGLQIRRYSKGMLQRVAVAQALVTRPRLLILDEPTSGLDPVGRREMRDVILQERDRGTTILFCTHIIPDVESVCDRVAVLVGGRLVREGSVQQLLRDQAPEHEIQIESLAPDRIEALGVPLDSVRPLDGRVLVRVKDAHAQEFLKAVLGVGGRVSRVQQIRFSLEDLFMQAISGAPGGSVGSEVA